MRLDAHDELRAPSARATATAKRPIVPQPTMATRFPRRFTLVQAWTALPNGSWMAATSGRMRAVSVRHKALAGSLAYSAKHAVVADADDLVVGADVGVADAALVADAADDVALGRDHVARLRCRTCARASAPTATTSPKKLVPDDARPVRGRARASARSCRRRRGGTRCPGPSRRSRRSAS